MQMKPRARRITIAAAVLGVTVIGVLMALNWSTVRDHVEAWRFQLARQTTTIEPHPAEIAEILEKEVGELGGVFEVIVEADDRFVDLEGYLFILAAYTGRTVVIFDPAENVDSAFPRTRRFVKDQGRLLRRALESQHFDAAPAPRRGGLSSGVADAVLEVLRANGLCILE